MNRRRRITALALLYVSGIFLPVGLYVLVGWFIMPYLYPGRDPAGSLRTAQIVGLACLALMMALVATAVALTVRWRQQADTTSHHEDGVRDGAARDPAAGDGGA
jgi:hypothetical protein